MCEPCRVSRTEEERVAFVWRWRLTIACGLVVIFSAFTIAGIASGDWIVTAVVGVFLIGALARVWLMLASRQPVSYLGAVVIMFNGPRDFITSSGRDLPPHP